ncbi:YIP1 family protein [Methanosarcina sp. DH2]|uniref:YIP1 family protein n=1 Tax=Methanosarcina sp. DH2 TaxID=2605639 RepID=UPI001E447114|nr:YIP1 family protein [Methanosarcina sp. DH2]MCC4771341.1 YIP1 family protein [Methanosarcina sp. DH2]
MDNLNFNNLLFDPNSFFREKSRNNVDFKFPVLIIFVTAIIAMVSNFLVMNQFSGLLPSDMSSSISTIAIVFGIAGGLIGTFLYWFLLTGILYSISYVFDSKGSFKRTLEFIGYGFVPQIFSSLIGVVITYKLTASADFSSQDPQLITESVTQMFSNNPLYYTSQIIGILCLLLSAYIWVFALLHARNMSIKNATLTVGIPVGLYVVYMVYLFLFTSGSI